MIYDHASLEGWYLKKDGQWCLRNWGNSPNPNKTIFPDSKDAIRGRFSCRIEVGGSWPQKLFI